MNKKHFLIGLLLLLMVAASVACADSWVEVEDAEGLLAALADPSATQIRLLGDVELPEEGAQVAAGRKHLKIDGAGHELWAYGFGLTFEAPSERERQVTIFDLSLRSEGDYALLRIQGEGKALAFTLQNLSFDGKQLIDNPLGDLHLENVNMDVYATIGSSRNITIAGENQWVRYGSSANTSTMLTLGSAEGRHGEGSLHLMKGATLSAEDWYEDSRAFLSNTYAGALFTIDEGAQLEYLGNGSFLTGEAFGVVRLEDSATLFAEIQGDLVDSPLSVNDTLLVSRGASLYLYAIENTRPVPLIQVYGGGKVSFTNTHEVVLINGCTQSTQASLTLAFQEKNGTWLNKTQLVELYGSASEITRDTYGTPDAQWRNGAGGVFKMDATVREDGSVAGLVMADYKGKVELSKETLSLAGVRALRIGDVNEPDILLTPAETPEPEKYYASSDEDEDRELLWWEDGYTGDDDTSTGDSTATDTDSGEDFDLDGYVPQEVGEDGSTD